MKHASKVGIMSLIVWLTFNASAFAVDWNSEHTILNGDWVSDNITLTGNVTVNVPSGTAEIGGIISGPSSYTLTKTGTGTLQLRGNNTYSGATIIQEGTLEIVGSIAGSSGVTINEGAVLLTSGNKTIKALSGSSTSSWVALGSNTLTIGTSDTSADGGGTFAGVISGTNGGITKQGTATLTLTNANTYTGATNIYAGTLALGTNGTVANSSGVNLWSYAKLDISAGSKTIRNLDGSGTVELGSRTLTIGTSGGSDGGGTFYGTISGTGGITKTGSATFSLGATNTYEGATTVQAGTLSLNYGLNNGTIENSSGLTLNGFAVLDISAGTNTANKTIRALNGGADTKILLSNRRRLIIGTLGGSNGGGSFSGVFSGTGGSVTKRGTATFTMSNNGNSATGLFDCLQGTTILSGNWAGNFDKSASATVTVGEGNRSIGGYLNLQGGATNMNLSGTLPSRLSVTGALFASGTNTLNITGVGSSSSYTLISAASGVSTDNFTLTGETGTLYAPDDKQLVFTSHIPVTDITGVPETATAFLPLTLEANVLPADAANKTITWTVDNAGTTGATIASGTNILNTTNSGTVKVLATIVNGASPTANYTKPFDIVVSKAALSGTATVTGNAAFGQTLTAVTTALTSAPVISPLGTLSYQWRRGTTNISGATSETYTLVQADIDNTINVVITAENCSGSVTSDNTASVTKATQTAPAAPVMESKTATSITLNTVAGCEYSIDGGAFQELPVFANLSPETSYSFTQRYAETTTHSASLASAAAVFSTNANEKPLHKIISTVNNPTFGTITPYGEAVVEEGDDITFTITPNSGYVIDEVLVDGVNIPEAVTSGSYTFENVTTDGTIEVIFAQTVGISEMTADKINIYPNPTNNVLNFSSETPFEIINIQGKVLLKSEKAEKSVNVSGLPAGIYFVKFEAGKVTVTKKFVKEL